MKKILKINSKKIGINQPPFVIAEIGINHGGDYNICKEMIFKAIESGADAVKLQTVIVDESYEKNTPSYNEFKNKNLNITELRKLNLICKKNNVILFSSPGGNKSLDLIMKLNFPIIKISSGQMTNLDLISNCLKFNKPLIISTGMAFENEIDKILSYFSISQLQKTILLKCTSLYPSPDSTINLNGMTTLMNRYKHCHVGYSDHTLDDFAPIVAVSMGATVIEKHFTINNKIKGGDNFISMEPNDFRNMVNKIKRIRLMLGYRKIRPTKNEIAKRTHLGG